MSRTARSKYTSHFGIFWLNTMAVSREITGNVEIKMGDKKELFMDATLN